MASLVVGGLMASGAASGALFKYNRKSFFFDKKMRQEREFQEQDMRVEQFGLYREDIRDLVELTVAKMDLYLIAAALLADRLTVMICTETEALTESAPKWAVALNSMSLASGMFYLLLCLWLAMYASVSAQAYGVRLLTQFVRLPFASAEQITAATACGTDYEERELREMMRVPIMQRDGPGTRDATGGGSITNTQNPESTEEQQTRVSDGNARPDPTNMLPTAMLNHIRLYRRMQLNWLAYDAYARVSLFAGASSLLCCCNYWSLGQFLQNEHAVTPGLGVSIIFASVQWLLARLDMRIRATDVVAIGALLAAMPILTTVGMLLHQNIKNGDGDPHLWKTVVMECCACATHALHAIAIFLLLVAAWPDRANGDTALLPGRFRSTLFLDVFGWLLNPGGPGMGSAHSDCREQDEMASTDLRSAEGVQAPVQVSGEQDTAEDDPSEQHPEGWEQAQQAAAPSRIRSARLESDRRQVPLLSVVPPRNRASSLLLQPSQTQQLLHRDESASIRQRFSPPSSPGGRSIRRLSQNVDLNSEIKNEARRLFAESFDEPQGQTSLAQEPRWGGSEAQPLEQMAIASAPTVDGAMAFGQVRAARRISRNARPPGERPWLAFFYATSIILSLWTLSTIWAVVWRKEEIVPKRSHTTNLVLGTPFAEICAVGMEAVPLSLKLIHTRRAQVLPKELFRFLGCDPWWAASRDIQHSALNASGVLADDGCGLRWPVKDASIVCHHGEDRSQVHCMAVLLRRGGRAVTFCHVRQRRSGKTVLTGAGTLRIDPSAPALQQVALMWPSGLTETQLLPLYRRCPEHFRIFAKTSAGGILALTSQRVQTAVDMPELGHSGSIQCRLSPLYDVEPPAQNVDLFILSMVGRHLLTIQQPRHIDYFVQETLNNCSAGYARDIVAWDTSTGERKTHRLGHRVSW